MRERFAKDIFTDGRCGLAIRTPDDIQAQAGGHDLLPDGDSLDPKEITPRLLYMLAEAYHAGYCAATHDGEEAVRRLVLETNQHRKPAPRIYPSEVIDYRAKEGERT